MAWMFGELHQQAGLQLIGINLMWRVYFLEIAVGDQTQSCNILLSTMLTRRDSVENVWTSLLARFHTAGSHGQNSWGSVGKLKSGIILYLFSLMNDVYEAGMAHLLLLLLFKL